MAAALGRPHRVGVGVGEDGHEGDVGRDGRLGRQLLGAQAEAGEDAQVGMELALGREDLGELVAHPLGTGLSAS